MGNAKVLAKAQRVEQGLTSTFSKKRTVCMVRFKVLHQTRQSFRFSLHAAPTEPEEIPRQRAKKRLSVNVGSLRRARLSVRVCELW